MKKYSILLAMVALVLSSLACQTIMGGGSDGYQTPAPEDSAPTSTSGDDVDSGDVNVGGDSEFPMPSDAFNVVTAPDTVVYQTKLSGDDVIKFYQDEFGKLGYTEDTSLTVTFAGTLTMTFDGHESGKRILIAGGPAGDGSTAVTITLQ
jgi:hypothetical protein